MPQDVSFERILEVRDHVARHTRRTPLLRSEWLSAATGAEVWIKCEGLQVTGSFKVRGALAFLALRRPRVVLGCSAGNHGVGLAFAAREAAVPCTIVVPRDAPAVKAEAIAALGARVIRSPHSGYDETEAWTLERREELGGTFVSPYDDPAVVAGNGGTTALEILEDAPPLDAIVVPCGGGGLATGIGIAARRQSPGTRILGVNTDASPGMWRSFRDGRAHVRVEGRPTIAEGLEGGVSPAAFARARRAVDEILLVEEGRLRRAVAAIARHEHLVVEGSGAAGVAALLAGRVEARRLAVVLTGANLDPSRLAALLAETSGDPGG